MLVTYGICFLHWNLRCTTHVHSLFSNIFPKYEVAHHAPCSTWNCTGAGILRDHKRPCQDSASCLKKGLELKNQLDEDGPRSWAGGVKGILSAPPLLASGRGVWREPIELTGGRGRRGASRTHAKGDRQRGKRPCGRICGGWVYNWTRELQGSDRE